MSAAFSRGSREPHAPRPFRKIQGKIEERGIYAASRLEFMET